MKRVLHCCRSATARGTKRIPLAAVPICLAVALGQPAPAVAGEYITMDDGKRLYVDVTLPSRTNFPGKVPFVLYVDPYGDVPSFYFAGALRRAGIATVRVQPRGTGNSEGNLSNSYLSEREIQDSVELVKVFTDHERSNRKVGMWGPSYPGFNAMLTAVHPAAPASLKAVAGQFVAGDLYRDVAYHGGILNFSFGSKFVAAQTAGGHLANPPTDADAGCVPDPAPGDCYVEAKLRQLVPPNIGTQLYENVTDNEFYRSRSAIHRAQGASAAVLLIGGWRDAYVRGTTELYKAFAERDGIETRLYLEPCAHTRCASAELRNDEAPYCQLDAPSDHVVAFFKRHLRGEDDFVTRENCGVPPEPFWTTRSQVRYFIQTCATVDGLGAEVADRQVRPREDLNPFWETLPADPGGRRHVEVPCDKTVPNRMRNAETWPPENTDLKRYLLKPSQPDGLPSTSPACVPNSIDGSELLAERGPAEHGSACYATNPAAGFSMAFDQYGAAAGVPYVPTDQRTEAAGGLTWRTSTLKEPLTLVGSSVLRLHAASTAPDTDWHATLSDVNPEVGTESIITEGRLRASHRELDEKLSTTERPYHKHSNPTPIQPGRFYRYDIEIWPTAYRLDKGHKLQLRLTSIDVPSHLPGTVKLGTEDGVWRFEPHLPALNTIRYGGPSPSALFVSVLDE